MSARAFERAEDLAVVPRGPAAVDEAAGVVGAAEAAAAEARDERLGEPLAPATMKDDFAVSGQKSQEGLIQDGTDQVQCLHVHGLCICTHIPDQASSVRGAPRLKRCSRHRRRGRSAENSACGSRMGVAAQAFTLLHAARYYSRLREVKTLGR